VGNGLNTPALLFGIILLVASIGLFFWGRLKPELARDSDNVYSILGIICSIILFTSAFDLSLILGFQQLLLIGSVIALMWENIRLRTPNPDARQSSFPGSKRDDDRPRRPARAERVNEYEEFGAVPRGGAGLEGRRPGYADGYDNGYGATDKRLPRRDSRDDDRTSRRGGYGDDSWDSSRDEFRDTEAPRSIPSRSSRPARDVDVDRVEPPAPERPRRRRPSEGRDDRRDGAGMESSRESRSSEARSSEARPRRRSVRVEDVRSEEDIPAADYVDYKPLEPREPKPPSGSSWGPQD
jgi:Ycf66 protein N-terminus